MTRIRISLLLCRFEGSGEVGQVVIAVQALGSSALAHLPRAAPASAGSLH